MKVVQINSVANWGSTGRIVESLGLKIIENMGESYIIYGRKNASSSSVLIRIGGKFDFLLHFLLTRLFDKHGSGSIVATRKLIKHLENIKPDLIHLHNLHGYYLNLSLLFSYLNLNKTPVVWTLHDCWAFTGHCAYYDYIGCQKWQNECFKCPQKKSYPASILFDSSKENYRKKKELFSNLADCTIVTVSNWLKNQVEMSFLRKYPIQIIKNGINRNIFYPHESINFFERYGLENKKILLGVASSWSKRKGLADFIRLAESLDDDHIIVLIGLTKKQLKKIPKKIVGLPVLENINELLEFYSNSSILLNLSYEETFGMTIIEAYSCGTPCISYDRTATPELINDETGIVVQAGNIKQIIDAIQFIESHGKEFYRRTCIREVEEKYLVDDRFQDYLNLYKKILSRL